MISQLPRWVWGGGFLLASIAGFVNAVAVLGFEHQAVSHVTGTTTHFAVSAVTGAERMGHYAALLASFFLGCVGSGFLVGGARLQLGRLYGVAMTLEGLVLFGAMVALEDERVLGDYLASFACGLQNAMASSYSGAVLRTTHMSGLVTDLGIALGQRLRGKSPNRSVIFLYLALLTGFVAGGLTGGLAFDPLGPRALVVPATLCVVAGTGYMVWRRWFRQSELSGGPGIGG